MLPKDAIRKTMVQNLRKLSQSEISRQGEQAAQFLLTTEMFRRSNAISCFLSLAGEIDTRAIALGILREGKRLYVPRVTEDHRHMQMLRVYSEADLDSLRPMGPWGIREPTLTWRGGKREDATSAEDGSVLDMVLIPGVAFDMECARLGHGKGFYDRFISDYTRRTPYDIPFLVGLSLLEQVVGPDIIPMEPHDWRVDYLLTASGLRKRPIKEKTFESSM